MRWLFAFSSRRSPSPTSSAAHAHTAASEVGHFYAGVLHPVTALEHLLSFVALGLLVGQQGRKASSAVLMFSVMLMLGAMSALWVPAVPSWV